VTRTVFYGLKEAEAGASCDRLSFLRRYFVTSLAIPRRVAPQHCPFQLHQKNSFIRVRVRLFRISSVAA